MVLPKDLSAGVLKATDYLEGHVNCRCTLIPRAKSYGELLGDPSLPDTRPPIETGAQRFAKLPKDTQRQILGPGKFALYEAGVPLEAFQRRVVSDSWGASRVSKSLKQVTEEVAAGQYATTANQSEGSTT